MMTKEQKKLCAAVDAFADKMKARLLEKHKQGFTGWEGPALEDVPERMLHKSATVFADPKEAEGKTLVDIANFAMMLAEREKP